MASALEHFLARRWQEILGVDAVGPHDNFFDLGGDSIRAAIFFNQVQQALGEVISVATIFDVPTVAGLAAHLTRHHPDAAAKVGVLGSSEDVEARAEASGPAQAPVPTIGAKPIAPSTRRLTPGSTPARRRGSAENGNRPAVFILAPPRSGSTLLRVMLGGHPDLFAPPELELLSYKTPRGAEGRSGRTLHRLGSRGIDARRHGP